MDYQKQGEDFLKQTRTVLKTKYLETAPYFDGDIDARDIYRFTLRRARKSYTARFGQSIASAGQEPTAYDILTCITKYNPGTFESFCSEYGFDMDSRRAEKIYKDTLKEWAGVERLFSDVLKQLREIN